MNVFQKLKRWQEAGLLTSVEAENIIRFENKNAKPYLIYGLFALALFCIGLGIVSLVAANWALIPKNLKLGADFTLLIGCGALLWNAYRQGIRSLFEPLLILFELLLLASIGLIGQIYHLTPDSLTAFFFWSLLSFPLWFFAQWKIVPFMGLPILSFSFLDFVYAHEHWLALWNLAEKAWPASVPLISLQLTCLLSIVIQKIAPEGGLKKALDFWLVVAFGVFIYALDRGYAFNPSFGVLPIVPISYTSVFAWLFSFVLVLTVLETYLIKRWNQGWLLGALSVLIIIGALIHLPLVLSLAALLIVGLRAYQKGRLPWIKGVLFLAGLRLLVLYCHIFEGLLQTGLSLIAGGLLLLLLVIFSIKINAWLKRRIPHEK